MLHLSFTTTLLVVSCLVSIAFAQPFFGLINSTSVIYNSTSDSTTTYFFDIQGLTLNEDLVILAGSSYNGKNPSNVVPRVFLRRWAPAGSDYTSATNLCQANQNVNASLNPNECVYADITANSEHAVIGGLGNPHPRAGRYFLSVFVPPNTLQNNQPLSFSLEVRHTDCAAGFGGPGCLSTVEALQFDSNQASPPPGTVAAGEWKYFSLMVSDTATSQIVFTFNTPPAIKRKNSLDLPPVPVDDTAGFYMRYGNIPTVDPPAFDIVRLAIDTGSPNWITPFLGTYIIGFYGGLNGTAYDFSVELQICAQNTGGAWCQKDTRTPLSRPSCPTPSVKQCLSDLIKIELNAEYNIVVPAETWVYSLLIFTSTQYSLTVGAKATSAGATLVISPEALPENNAETTALFNLANVYPVVATLSTTKTIYSYNYLRPGEIYIGIYGGAVDSNVTFAASAEVCPLNCNGVENACDPVSNSCTCPPVSGYTVDEHTCAKSKNDNGLSTGAIVAISILVPLGIIILLGGGLFALWWFKFRQNAYDTI